MARKPRFLRSDTARHSRLGKNRPKLQKWRRPRGRHSKIRRKRFSYPRAPTVGYGSPKVEAGRINSLLPRLVHNVSEMDALNKTNIAIIARIGARKKLEVIKRAQEKGIQIANVKNPRLKSEASSEFLSTVENPSLLPAKAGKVHELQDSRSLNGRRNKA